MKHLIYLLIIISATACVPNKKVVLLQKDDLYQEDMEKDSVMRVYHSSIASYKLSAGDIIRIQIASLTDDEFDFFKEDMSQGGGMGNNQPGLIGEMIDRNGNVKYPVIGSVKMEGLTILEAETKLREIAREYVADPVVKIRLLNYRVTLLGEVNSPGSYTTLNADMAFVEALGYAGGFSEMADIDNIKLIRKIGDKQHIIYLDPLKEEFIMSPYFYLYPNDLILVPPLQQRPFREYFGPNLSLFVSSLSILLLIYNLLNG